MLMQRDGFGAVCKPWGPVAARGNGTFKQEKSWVPVEIRGHSVLRCKPCGHFLAGAGPETETHGPRDGGRDQVLEAVTEQGTLNRPWNRLAMRESNKRIERGYG